MVDEAITSAAATLGYSSLHREQRDAVRAIVLGNDVFVALPTGYGKSLCYAILPLVFDKLLGRPPSTSIVVCVSPLVALMQDQKGKFSPKGLTCEYVREGLDSDAIEQVKRGACQLIFITPEAVICNSYWRELLRTDIYQNNLVALVVDEAHCVKKWGEQFRKAYSRIGEIRSILPPTVHVMALTATATRHTRIEVMKKLCMKRCELVCRSPHKSNIALQVKIKSDLQTVLMPLVCELRESRASSNRTIIYCKRYDEVVSVYRFFKRQLGKQFTEPVEAPDLPEYRLVDMYTKCTDPIVKEAIVGAFAIHNSKLRIVVATIAFGMGIDCPNISQVIHWGPSSSVEDYVQEIGRSGRDPSIAACATLYYVKGDQQYTSGTMMEYCKNTDVCRRQLLFSGFDEFANDHERPSGSKCCDICANV